MLPAICGRVCPQENQCEGKCIRGKKSEPWPSVSSSASWVTAPSSPPRPRWPPRTARRSPSSAPARPASPALASSPATALTSPSLSLLHRRRRAGLRHPRVPVSQAVVKREIDGLEDMGVKFEYNSVVGNMATAEELFEQGFDAIYVATGAGLPKFLNVPGENLPNVFFANEYLTRVNLMKANKFPEYDTPTKHGKNVVVFGGGNVAMDAVRTAKRLAPSTPSSPTVVPRTRCPAVAPSCTMLRPRASRFCRSSPRSSLSLARTAQCAPSRSRRWSSASPTSPAAVARCPSRAPSRRSPATSRSRLSALTPTPSLPRSEARWSSTSGLHRRDEETGQTTDPRIWAGGDIVTGAATVILAMGAGKKAAAPSPRAYWVSNHLQR